MDPKKSQIDTTFGIRYEDGDWMISNKRIKINGDDITIDGEVYGGTPGLWSLITDKAPNSTTMWTWSSIKNFSTKTSAMRQHYNSHDPYPRASGGKKWTQILAPIWNEFEMTGVVASNDDDDETDSVDGTLVDKDSDDREGELQDSSTALGDDDESVGEGIMRMNLQKEGLCFGLQKCGKGTPRPRLGGIHGSGLYLRVGSNIYDGEGLLLGSKSPFKKISILGWIL